MPSSHDNLSELRDRIQIAYRPEHFRAAGRRLIDALAEKLTRATAGEGPVLPWRDPAANVSEARAMLDAAISPPDAEAMKERFARLADRMLEAGHNLHNPRYIGHQVPAPIPLAGLFDALGAITNQCMATYEMGPWATAAEWAMVDALGKEIGWAERRFAGLATHGGSLANLTALLTARNVSLPDSWDHGTAASGASPVLVVQADAHYSVARSAGILGIGSTNVLRAALDDRRRIDPERLDRQLQDLRRQGRPIAAVVACACATPIGAFDPLAEIAEVCHRHGVWLHVDAAHGGAAVLSDRYRGLVSGLERADSLVWDAHKMLFVPALCAFVFYREGGHRFETFRQDAPYLFDPAAPGLADYDSGLRTVECTKRGAALGLWGAWAILGRQFFADLVDLTFTMGHAFYEKLADSADFAPLHEPQCNIVVFRHIPDSLKDASPDVLGRFQLALRRRLVESGDFFIVSTRLDGVGALRTTIINPLTTPGDLDRLLDALRRHGRALLAEGF